MWVRTTTQGYGIQAITTGTLGRKTTRIRKIRIILPKRSLIPGPFVPIMKIVGDTGIYDILKKHLTDEESKEIIAIATSKIVRPLPVSSVDTWFEGTSLSRTMNIEIKSQKIS